MSNFPLIPLQVASNIEKQASWEGISTPHDMAEYIARIVSVNPDQLKQFDEVIYSDVEPSGEDRKKIWFKTDKPVGIGVPSGSDYILFYQYPTNTPILWLGGKEKIPSYSRKLTTQQLEDYGLKTPLDSDIVWIVIEV